MGKPRRQIKPTTKARRPDGGYGSEDELALSDGTRSDLEEKVEFYTTDAKSPFVNMDLIVSHSHRPRGKSAPLVLAQVSML